MRHYITTSIFAVFTFLHVINSSAQPLKLVSSQNYEGYEIDLWGYVDQNENEYILIGSDTALYIVNVNTPVNPQLVSTIIMPGSIGFGAFDVKVWQNYAYVVSGSALDTGLIYDISNPQNPKRAGKFPDSHNIFISPGGYLITEGPKMKIFNLNNSPVDPELIYSTSDNDGHDAAVIGDRLFDFHGGLGTNIYSTSNMSNPVLLGNIPATISGYSHSGWVTDDGNFLLVSCEICDYPDLSMWDIRDYNNMILTDVFDDTSTSTHNVQIRGSYAFVSSYRSGLRVFKISDPFNIRLVAEYDPEPGSQTGFSGTFGVYVFSESGYIFASDSYEGLMIFEFDSTQVSVQNISSEIPESYTLHQNYPNPFNPVTRIRFEIPSGVRGERSEVRLSVFDVTGREVAELVKGELQAGVYEYEFDGTGLGSGVYFYKLQSGEFSETRRMVLVK